MEAKEIAEFWLAQSNRDRLISLPEVEAIKQVSQTYLDLLKQHEQDSQDAKRYRYLRASYHFGGNENYSLRWYLPRHYGGGRSMREQLDECIDSAIGKAND